jgi:capsular polysaccharide biosynthesis protein
VSRLPPALQPIWPLAKRLHRLASLLLGVVGRRVSGVWGDRRLPVTASLTPARTAHPEPGAVRFHPGPPGELIGRTPPDGDPSGHWTFRVAAAAELPAQYTLEIDRGVVVGDYGAIVTPGHRLDYQTSEYFGIASWREHPIFLRSRLPAIEEVAGNLAVLATRGGSTNYYHFLVDVLPRLGVLEATLPGTTPDAWYLPDGTRYQRELLALLGLDTSTLVATGKHRAVRADTLLVPSLPNPEELAPGWLVAWLRERLPAVATGDKPRRIFVTRGGRPHTRRLQTEPALWPQLERLGFVRIDPGAMSVRDQIDHFAAAEAVIGVHGAALTNLVFASPGVRVLELFAPAYLKHCFWAITCSIPGAEYRYLVGDGATVPEGGWMKGVQDDIAIAPRRVLDQLDWLLGRSGDQPLLS